MQTFANLCESDYSYLKTVCLPPGDLCSAIVCNTLNPEVEGVASSIAGQPVGDHDYL